MKIALIVGNGFNFVIRDLINNYPKENIPKELKGSTSHVAKEVEEITVLWKRFNEIFGELRANNPGLKLNDEQLIRMIYSVLDLFSNISEFEQVLNPIQMDAIKSIFDDLLVGKVREIAKEFREHQASAGLSYVKQMFPAFGTSLLKILDEKQVKKFHIYTTNYDGILDTLLTGDPRGFIFQDGFRGSGFLKLEIQNIQNTRLLLSHVHGSYRFQKLNGTSYKMASNGDNPNPVMIFNNPEVKEDKIRTDNILSQYYYQLNNDLASYDKLIIFGNSMESEPHLKNVIKQNFNREGTKLFTCSRDPDKIAEQVQGSYNYDIIEKSTRHIRQERQLLEFFSQMIDE